MIRELGELQARNFGTLSVNESMNLVNKLKKTKPQANKFWERVMRK